PGGLASVGEGLQRLIEGILGVRDVVRRIARTLRRGQPDQERIDVDGVAGDAGLGADKRGGPGATEGVEHARIWAVGVDQVFNDMERIGRRETQPTVAPARAIGAKRQVIVAGRHRWSGRFWRLLHSPFSHAHAGLVRAYSARGDAEASGTSRLRHSV